VARSTRKTPGNSRRRDRCVRALVVDVNERVRRRDDTLWCAGDGDRRRTSTRSCRGATHSSNPSAIVVIQDRNARTSRGWSELSYAVLGDNEYRERSGAVRARPRLLTRTRGCSCRSDAPTALPTPSHAGARGVVARQGALHAVCRPQNRCRGSRVIGERTSNHHSSPCDRAM